MAPRKVRHTSRATLLQREVRVTSTVYYISARADKPRGGPPQMEALGVLELAGGLDMPIRDQTRATVHVYARDDANLGTSNRPSIGAVLGFKPTVDFVVSIPMIEFERAWAMANSGNLTYCHLVLTEPYRRSALVTSVSLSNRSSNEE